MLKNILKVVSIISSIAILSGCLGGGSSSTPASSSATTYSASSYFTKTAAGNTWTLSGTTTDSGVVNSSGTILDVYTNTAYSNGVETQTDTTTTNGSLGTPLTSTAYLAADGSLQTNNISSGTIVNLPSTFAAGTTWIAAPAYATASATASAYIGTIESVGVACSSNSQTFTDCIKVNFSGSFTTTGTVNAGTYSFTGTLSQTQYYSPTVGNIVQFTTTTNGTYSGSVTGAETFIQSEQLQAGYIAN